jgi:acetylornithine deacetylase/succinyl-diaminopimelate desuccinylase-like protein
MADSPIYTRPAEILQKLIQFDTTNPPGNEAACIKYIQDLLSSVKIKSTLLERTKGRPNLVARIEGAGKTTPILLYGHVDVVTAEDQNWEHPPFGGELIDGYVWGRGALDMKGGVAMMVAAFMRLKAEGIQPPGDVVLAIVGDEEAGGDDGAKFLVEKHADLFKDIRFALGEFGGFTMQVAGRRFYPIMIAEKQICWMKATVRGQGGHGSMPVKGGAMAQLSRLLKQLDEQDLPVHITPPTRMMIEAMASALKPAQRLLFGQLNNPSMTNTILKLLGERGRVFYPLFHNTVSPTILKGSSKINVIPSEASVELDGRLLPGFSPEDMMAELRPIVGESVDLEVVDFDPGPAAPNMELFDTLAGVLTENDPEGVPAPLILSGVTDGRFFSRLGIQTYGFLPMTLPEDFNFTGTIHAANERIPAEAVDFGANAIFKVLQRFDR